MFLFPRVRILGADREAVCVQAGMGAGVSLAPLASAAARRGWVGIISSIGLDRMVSARLGREVGHVEAAKIEVEEAIRQSQGCGLIGVNCMAAVNTYRDSVRGAVAGGARLFIVGAGLPLSLPAMVDEAKRMAGVTHDIALVPIVSSLRALEVICRKWSPTNLRPGQTGRMPDAVVVEGPLAGGHLGFDAANIMKPEFQLEAIAPPILEFARKNGNFPVIVAGGIWDRAGIIAWLEAGAGGVQIGTRFLATHESSATDEFKRQVVVATADDIIVAVDPGSPSGMPFRIIADSSGYLEALLAQECAKCTLGYLLRDGECKAMESPHHFCICRALLAAVGRSLEPSALPIFTVGTNAARVDRIMSVDELITELTGYPV